MNETTPSSAAPHDVRQLRLVVEAEDFDRVVAFYRDVLAIQFGAQVPLDNEQMRPALDSVARSATPETTLRRIEAILACRRAIDTTVAPLLAVEAMALTLRAG